MELHGLWKGRYDQINSLPDEAYRLSGSPKNILTGLWNGLLRSEKLFDAPILAPTANIFIDQRWLFAGALGGLENPGARG